MAQSYLVQLFESQDDLGYVNPDFVFGESLPLMQMGEQLTSAHVI